jgi:hypothetical protein
VGGDVNLKAKGDIVGGDKVTTTTITNGFKKDDDKQKFLEQIEALRTTLRELQAKIAEAPALSQDTKDEISAAVLQQINTLKKANDAATGLTVAKEPPPDALHAITTGLNSTSTLLDQVKIVCDKAVGVAEKIEPYVSKALPILLAARHLFGLP